MPRLSPSRLNMEDGRIDRAALKDWGESALGVSANVFSGTSYTVNIESGTTFNVVLSANCSLVFQNPTGSGNACSFTLILKQGGGGGFTVSWPGAVYWQAGVNPTLGTAPGDYDIFEFSTLDGGAKWFGSVGSRDRLTSLGRLWAWGINTEGRLGTNSALSASSPVQIGTQANWAMVGSNSHTVAIKTGGSLWAWGENGFGNLGLNSGIADTSSPVQVGTLTNWAKVSSGTDHTVAIKTDGTLWSWGRNNQGQLGANIATTVSRSSPVQIGAGANWKDVSALFSNSLATKTDGTLWIWGDNSLGQLGLNTAIAVDVSSPTQVGTLTDWAQVKTGDFMVAAIKTNGTLWSWGEGTSGRLGIGSSVNVSSPVQVGTLTNWASFALGTGITAGLQTDGSLWTWGANNNGQLGQNFVGAINSPVQVGTLTDWAFIAAANSVVAIKTNGTMWAWGTNLNGQLGQNDISSRSSPVQVGTQTNWMYSNMQTGSQIMAVQF